MRKRFLKWLIGADWYTYWELHERYTKELDAHIKTLKDQITINKECQVILNGQALLIKENKKLIDILKSLDIDVVSEIKN